MLRALLNRTERGVQPSWVSAEVAQLLPELGTSTAHPTETNPVRLLSAVEHLVTQARDDGLDALILDDLHFCDTASIEVAQQLAAASTGVRWLVAMRSAEVSPEVHAYVDELVGNAHAQTLVLQPLNVAQIGELLDSLQIPGIAGDTLAAPLHQRTGGNVLYLLETMKALLQREQPTGCALDGQALAQLPVAPNVGRLIERRLNRLSAAALRLVRCAAIAGTDFSAPLASQVLGVRPLDLSDAWSELESAQVLRDGAFAHDLIFEAVLATVPPVIAVAFHGDVAAWLQSRNADPSRVAHHWQQAQQWPQAGPAWSAAAQHCALQGRRTEQARCLAQSAECYGQAQDPDRRVQALLERAAALAQYEVGDQTRAAFEELEHEVRTDAQRLNLISLRMVFANLVGEFDATLAMAPGALELAKALGDEAEVFTITNNWCGALTKSFRATEALALMQSLRPWVDERASDAQRYEYWNGLALALDFGNRLSESLPAWQSSCDVAEAMGSDLLPQAVNNMAYTYAKMGQHARAVMLARRALTINRSRADDFDVTGLGPIIRFALGHHLRNIGCYREAIALMEEAAQGFEAGRSPMLLASVQHQLALLWVQLGQPARAQALVAAELPQQTAIQQAQRCAFRAMVLSALGRPAVDEVRRALALVPNPDSVAHRMWTLVASILVEPQEGEEIAANLAVWARERERLGMALAAHGRAARCALASGCWERAVPHVQDALCLAREVQPDLYYLPELWWVAAQVYAAAGLREERRVAVRAGVEWIGRIASEHVPDPFRESFLQRNPINAQLMQWAAEI
jgi:tetratricopeptide (TPR) repeat protein